VARTDGADGSAPGARAKRAALAPGVRLSNPDKVLYPATGFTKADVADYYARIAPVMLPHLKDRPVSLKRYPNGVKGEFFWEKACPRNRPRWVQTAAVWSPTNDRHIDFCVVNNRSTLFWLANLAALELHTSLSRRRKLDRPTSLVFDLDPGPPANIVQCAQVALWIREALDRVGLQSLPKTSGSKGLQLFVPLNSAVDYEITKQVAHEVAERLERDHPELVVSKMTRSLRPGKVLIDWSQNDDHKTTVAVYSLRARTRPTVSTPVSWEEVEQTLRAGDPELLVFESAQLLERVARLGDLFEPLLRLRQALPAGAAIAGDRP
jgi:bifunctional non-homologous end joining protein LigD